MKRLADFIALAFCMALCLLFSSCSDVFADYALRTYSDPADEVPSADSFREENTVFLDWKEDEGADEYFLYRAVDHQTLNFQLVYRGTGLSYRDTDLNTLSRYVYRLDKSRGTRLFCGTHLAHAYASQVRRDSCEPNDDMSHARHLESDFLYLNSYYGIYHDDYTVRDEDWFFVTVPPRRKAEIVLEQKDLSAGARDTDFFYLVPGNSPCSVSQNIAFDIPNEAYEARKIYFKIYIKDNAVVQGHLKCEDYTLSLRSITYLSNS